MAEKEVFDEEGIRAVSEDLQNSLGQSPADVRGFAAFPRTCQKSKQSIAFLNEALLNQIHYFF